MKQNEKKCKWIFFLLFCIIGKLGAVLLSCNRESLEFLSFIDFYNVNPSYLYVSSFFRCFLSSHFKSKLYLLEYMRYIFYYWTIWKMKKSNTCIYEGGYKTKSFSQDLINPSFGTTGSSLGGRLSQGRVWIQGEICCPKYWNSMYLLQVLIEEMLLKWIHNSKVKAEVDLWKTKGTDLRNKTFN